MIKFKKSEVFKAGGKMFVVAQVAHKFMATRVGLNAFDRDNYLVHSKLGKMFMVPQNVEFKIVKG